MRTRTLALRAVPAALLLAAAALPASAGERTAEAGTAGGSTPGGNTVGAAELLADVKSCARISKGKYRTDEGRPATVPVCGKSGAVFWKADMDIDCDGRTTKVCNKRTDPSFLPDTAFRTSGGKPLDSARLPYVVVPGPGPRWDYRASGITGGSVVAVIHRGRVQYGVVGDTGPGGIIGEASYAMAEALGIDPDPMTGGVASGVTYILFKNSGAKPIESPGAAVAAGKALAADFVAAG